MRVEGESHVLRLGGIDRLVRDFTKGYSHEFGSGETLVIEVPDPYELLDLFYLGRFIAFLHQIHDTCGLKVQLRFGRRDVSSLRHIGLLDYCDGHGFPYNVRAERAEAQLTLPLPTLQASVDASARSAPPRESEETLLGDQFDKKYRVTLAAR